MGEDAWNMTQPIFIPKKISRFGGSLAIYLDMPVVAYLNLLNDDGSLKPIRLRTEFGTDEIVKAVRYNAKGSVVVPFTKREIELLGLVHEDIIGFYISS